MRMVNMHGFFSVVQHKADANMLMVRTIDRVCLENLKKDIPTLEIVETPDAKAYPYRTTVSREDFGKAIMGSINYPDFSAAVEGVVKEMAENHTLH